MGGDPLPKPLGGFEEKAAKPKLKQVDGGIVMDERELAMQIEAYKQIQAQSGISKAKVPEVKPKETISFDHGFSRFDTYSKSAASVPSGTQANSIS